MYFGITALYCVWVFTLPVFPSQDGPHHLYLVEIFGKLLAHSNELYSNTYYIGRYLPPYSAYYYGLIVLHHWMSLEMADKVMICMYFVVLATGVRSLLAAITGRPGWSPLLALPAMLNFTVMIGFLNYAFGIACDCFLLSLWCRSTGRWTPVRVCAFVSLTIVVLLTHPVAWLFAVSFLLFDLGLRALRAFQHSGAARAEALASIRPDAVMACVAASGYFYLRTFQGSAAKSAPSGLEPLWPRTLRHLHEISQGYGFAVFTELHRPLTLLYRLLLAVCVIPMVALAFRAFAKEFRPGTPPLSSSWAAYTVCLLVLLPFMPDQLNGSFFFAQRLLFPLYLCLVFTTAPWMAQSRIGLVCGVIAVGLCFTSLAAAIQRIGPVARHVDAVSRLPLVRSDKPGALLRHDPPAEHKGIGFDPYRWAGIRYFREYNLIAYDTAWLDQSHIPVKVRESALPRLDEDFEQNPLGWQSPLFSPPSNMQHTLERVGFVLGPVEAGNPNDDIRLRTDGQIEPQLANWHCLKKDGWEICTRPQP